MKRTGSIDQFLRPTRWMCITFGILTLPVITVWLWMISFVWVPGFTFYFIATLGCGAFGLILAHMLDLHFNVRLVRYVGVSLAILLVLGATSYPLRDVLLDKSEQRGDALRLKVEDFKEKYGEYPKDLSEGFFAEAPVRSLVGTPYVYHYDTTSQAYYIDFVAFYGYWCVYSTNEGKWIYVD